MNHVYWTWIVVVGFESGPSDVVKPSCSAAGAGSPKWRASYGFQTSKYKERSGNSQGLSCVPYWVRCFVWNMDLMIMAAVSCGVVLCLFSIWTVSVLNDVSCLLRRPQLDDCSVTNMLEAAFDYFSRRYIINILLKTMEDERLKQSINCFERAFVVSPAHSSRLPLLWRNCLVTVPQSNRLLYGCSL